MDVKIAEHTAAAVIIISHYHRGTQLHSDEGFCSEPLGIVLLLVTRLSAGRVGPALVAENRACKTAEHNSKHQPCSSAQKEASARHKVGCGILLPWAG